MSDGTVFQLGVDASKGRAELRNFEQSVERVGQTVAKLGASGGGFALLASQISSAASGFEKLKSVAGLSGVNRDINALSKTLSGFRAPSSGAIAGITQLAHALNALSRVNVPRGLGTNLSTLTRGLSDLRVPPMAELNRLPAIFSELAKASNVRINPQTGANVKYLADGLRAIGSIPAGSIAKLPTTFAALNKLAIDPTKAQALTGIGDAVRGLSDFRAPTTTAVNNLQRFLGVLQNADAARIRSVATALHGLTLPAINARTLPLASQAAPNTSILPALHSASSASASSANQFASVSAGVRQLESAFHGASGAIAAFAGALGGLTLGRFVSDTLAAGNSLVSFRLTLDTVATHAGQVGEHFDFVKRLANDTGGSLATMIPAFQQLGAAMQAMGYAGTDAQKVFGGFQKAFAVMHTPMADQRRALTELREVFSMEGGHARQVAIGMASHIPTLMSDIGKVAGKTAKEVHEMFKDGGIPTDIFVKLGDYYNKTFSVQLPEALRHSQAQLGRFQNAWFDFRTKIFESGFDTGLSTMLQRLTTAFDQPNVAGLAEKLGGGFRSAFTAIGTAGSIAASHADGFIKLGVAMTAVTAASLGMRIVGGIVGPLAAAATGAARLGVALLTLNIPFAIPLLAGAAALTVLVAQSGSAEEALNKIGRAADWVKDALVKFAVGAAPIVSATFSQMEQDGRQMVDVLKEVILYAGELRSWAANGFKQAPDWREQYQKRREALDSALTPKATTAAPGSDAFATKWSDALASVTAKAEPALRKLLGTLSKGALEEWNRESGKTAETLGKTSQEIHTQADYAGNAATALERQRRATEELQDAQKSLFDKLSPATAALKTYREELETLNGMQGRKDAFGNTIDAGRIASMRRQLQEQSLAKIDPGADSVRKLTESVEMKSRLAGDKDALADEQKIVEARNKSLAAGVTLTNAQEQAMRQLLAAERQLNKGGANGFQQWASNVKSESEMMADTVKSSLDDISSKLSDLVINGRGKFKSLGDAIKATFASILGDIAKKLIKNGIDSLMKQAIGGLGGMFGGGDNSIAKALGLGKAVTTNALAGMADKTIAAATATVNAATVTLNAAGIPGLGTGTSGLTGFNTNGTANSTGLGGVLPQPSAAAALANPPIGSISGGLGAFGSQTPASLLENVGTNKLAAVMGAVKAGTINVPNVSLAIGKAAQPLGGVTPGLSGFGALTPLTQARNVGIGNIGGMSGGTGFVGQAPASMLADRARALQAESTMARAGVQPTGVPRAFVAGDNSPAAVEAYIRQSAAQRGINPDIAARGFKQESQFRYDAKNINAREASFGPTQANIKGGLGNEMLKDGIDPRDHSTWRAQVDWSMNYAKKNGWGSWYGFRDSGITNKWEGIPRRTSALDMNPTGSIAKQSQSASQEFRKVGDDLSKSLSQSVKQAAPTLTQDMQKAFKGGSGVESELGGFASKIQETGTAATSAEGGLGGLIGKLGQLGSGGGGGLFGGGGGFGEMFAGAFSEGGYVDSPVSTASLPTSFWHGAPAFAEGGVTDGIPILAHPAEAVVPLSRGRSIPVELRGDDRRGGGDVNTHNTIINLQTKDADSFRRNANQVATALQSFIGRAAARNS